MAFFRWLFLGVRSNLDDGDDVAVGRAQTRLGRWWGRHPVMLRALALLALGWGTVYLVWRFGWSWRGANPWLSAALLIAEVYGVWNLAMLTWFAWRIDPAVRPETERVPSVDVYVCTYDEPLAVLRATLVGCAAMTHPHTTYLLDDGRRPEMERLATELGARYMTREDNEHAKAGNINAALPRTDGELVLVLDADHVPLPDALDALVGYFDDDRVALVQTPHDFYNHDSVQHYEIGRHEQSVFYSVIMPGKERHHAAFWCGSGAVIRRGALMEVGGVATETIAEDFHTTIKLHRAGWISHYHDEVLIQGLAPHDLGSYLLQRDRWARGNLAVFTTKESPLRANGLSALQRLSYFASLSSYLAGPMRLLALMTLAAVLWTGQLPLNATPLTLGLLWAPATFLSLGAGSALCRGFQRVSDTTHFELSTAEIYTRALRCVIRPGRTKFKVTPKEGVDHGGWEAISQLRAVTLVAVLLSFGVIARILEDSGIHVVPRLHGIAMWVVPLIAAFELRRVLRTLTLLGSRRQLRTQYRVTLDVPASLTVVDSDETPMIGRTRDITPEGLSLELPAAVESGSMARATVSLPSLAADHENVSLELEIVSCRQNDSGWQVGARITEADSEVRRRVLEYCHVVAARRRLRGIETPEIEALPLPTPLPAPLPITPALPAAAVSDEPAAAQAG